MRAPSRLHRPAVVMLFATLPLRLPGDAAAQEANPTTASSALYVRSDTDRTTVVTPRLHVGVPVADESRLDLVYTVDVWSSASIDIRTSASKRVVEQRDEIDVSVEHRAGDAVLGGSYRYSTEYDYESHGGTLGGAIDLAGKSAKLALSAKAYFDRVGRAGDPDFEEPTSTLAGRVAYSQILGPESLTELVYELTRQDGFLSSPYRYVRIAASDAAFPRTCAVPVQSCLLEHNPASHLRHAVALGGRHALSQAFSLGAGYRFYLDDWEMLSHTANLDGTLALDEGWLFSLGYRFYTQSAAVHYAPYYLAMPLPAFYTSDKELSTLSHHRIDVELGRVWVLDAAGSELGTELLVSPGFYQYQDFPLLDAITAIEISFAMELRL